MTTRLPAAVIGYDAPTLGRGMAVRLEHDCKAAATVAALAQTQDDQELLELEKQLRRSFLLCLAMQRKQRGDQN